MAINMSAIRPITQVSIPTAVDNMKTLAALKQQSQQGQMQDLQLADIQTKQQRAAAVHQILMDSGGNMDDTTIQKIMAQDPEAGLQLRQTLQAEKQRELANQQTQYTNQFNAAEKQYALQGNNPGEVPDTSPENTLPANGTFPALDLGGTRVVPNTPVEFPAPPGGQGFSATPLTMRDKLRQLTEQERAKALIAQESQKPVYSNLSQGGVLFKDGVEVGKGYAPREPRIPDFTIGNIRFSGETGQQIAVGPKTANPIDNERNLPELADITYVTAQGTPYVNVSQYTGKSKEALVTAAIKAGIAVPDKDTLSHLTSISVAGENAKFMLSSIESKLPKDAAGRLVKGPLNKLSELSQNDPVLGAIGQFRIAAIQQIQALSTGPGLRINQAEINAAMENDIPRDTDTLDTARQRVINLQKFLSTSEKYLLGVKAPKPDAKHKIGETRDLGNGVKIRRTK